MKTWLNLVRFEETWRSTKMPEQQMSPKRSSLHSQLVLVDCSGYRFYFWFYWLSATPNLSLILVGGLRKAVEVGWHKQPPTRRSDKWRIRAKRRSCRWQNWTLYPAQKSSSVETKSSLYQCNYEVRFFPENFNFQVLNLASSNLQRSEKRLPGSMKLS